MNRKIAFRSVSVVLTTLLMVLAFTACLAQPVNIREYYNKNISEFTDLESNLSNSAQTMKIYPESDDILVFECTIMQDISPSSEVTSLFSQEFNKQRSNFEEQVAEIKKEALLDKLTISVKYLNQNGELLYEDSVS